MTSSVLVQIHASLLELRASLAQPGADLDVEPLRRDVSRLIAIVEAELSREIPATAYERLERLQTIEPAFEALHRKWSELRDTIAAEAAEELRNGLNLQAGWQQRWGALFDVAWALREMVLSGFAGGRGRGDTSRYVGRPADRRASGLDPSLALDLRYAGGLPFAQIGGLVGLSPAAIQLRILEFEDEVLREFGRQAVERQIPEGWRVATRDAGPGLSPRHLVLRRAGGGGSEVMITLVSVKDERDASVGRPRTVRRFDVLRERVRGAPVWAVVLEAGPEVWFVPANVVSADALQSEPVASLARSHGLAVLADAIAAAIGGGGRMS